MMLTLLFAAALGAQLSVQPEALALRVVWGPQPHKGVFFFSDFHRGLWAVRFADSRDRSSKSKP